ncbi:MAG: tRNA (guanosine(37)-N1)-methyltransferase TrmD, partial [Candidatus Omnitrophota bacterium]|nr:tRNA (guanosine(37)-N1)-methyltransferase TrmD [Candidatus Omnitrophota bacterium]
TDDKPLGGGPGMVMKVEPVWRALDEIRVKDPRTIRFAQVRGRQGSPNHSLRSGSRQARGKVILLTPQGKKFDQKTAKRLAKEKRLVLICGHYEGVDERIRELADEEISIGDYVLTCGELPALVIIDAVVRLIPGVLGHKDSIKSESFEDNLLEYPQYTRPAKFKDMKVPDVLLSGDHKNIEAWREKEALKRTKKRRPDLFNSV